MGKRVISFGLTEQDLDRAIKELADYKKELIRKVEIFRQKVAERLAEEAQDGFNFAIVDDVIGDQRMADVRVTIDNRGSVTVVIANGEDAVWVEFGAGVFYNGPAGSSPHPHGKELGMTIGDYGKKNGRKNVWGFYENGVLRKSRGAPAKMPMARAVTTVCADIQSIAKEVFG